MATPDARAAISGWSFDDARPGLTIEHPGGRTIGTDEHAWLAMVTNNASDLHGNVEYARTTEFGQPVVLGALAVAIVVGLGQPVEWPPADAARCQPAGWTRIRLTRAVSPGDTLRAVSTIVSVVPRRDGQGGLVNRRLIGRNQRGEDVLTIDEERLVPGHR